MKTLTVNVDELDWKGVRVAIEHNADSKKKAVLLNEMLGFDGGKAWLKERFGPTVEVPAELVEGV